MSVPELFCAVDDFCTAFCKEIPKQQLASGGKRRQRGRSLCESEIMTILILFHQSHYRTFKAFYTEYVCEHLRIYFPHVVSYTRFVEFIPTVLMALCAYLKHCFGNCTGISFLDATTLDVCDNRRIGQPKVFDGLAKRGKSSMGWFFGFKLHLIFNDRGELLNMTLTPGNVDDRVPVPDMVKDLFGKIFADKGYISQPLFEQEQVMWPQRRVDVLSELQRLREDAGRIAPSSHRVRTRQSRRHLRGAPASPTPSAHHCSSARERQPAASTAL
jgi:hypothetical protein